MPRKRITRRQVTLICTDVVGYSRLMGIDEEWTLGAYRELRRQLNELVARFRGRIFGAAGDSLMAEFGDPVDAVRCAVAVQQAAEERCQLHPGEPEMRFRIGVNSGEVMVQGDDLFGDDVNITARLQEIAGSGGLTISEAVHKAVADHLEMGFEFLGELHFKNIRMAVRVYHALLKTRHAEARMPSANVDVSSPVPGFGGRPAIAVLPFTNLTRADDVEYIVDGLTDDIIAGLSALRWFPLIARTSSFVYRGKPTHVTRIGKALGARYLVDGTVFSADDHLRVTAELIDAESGCQVWSQKYDRTIHDIFEVQDDVARSIIGTLDPEIERIEQKRANEKPKEQLDTWGIIRRGKWHLDRFRRADAQRARELFEEALEKDSDSAEACVHLALWHFWDIWARRGQRDEWRKMEAMASQAIARDDKDPRSHMWLGIAQVMRGEPELGRGPLRRALELNPSQTSAHVGLGTSYLMSGQAEPAIEPFKTGMRLSPHDPYIFHPLGELAQADHMLGRWSDAIELAERSLGIHPRYWYAHVLRVCCLARMGRTADAKAALAELLSRREEFSLEFVRWVPFRDQHWNDYMIEGLREAGYRGS